MSEFAGKVVETVELTDREDVLIVRFADGTGLRVVGHSYEEVSLSVDAMSPGDVQAAVVEAEQAREKARLRRLEQEAFAALSPEERARRDFERWEKMSPFELAMEDAMRSVARSSIADMNRQGFFGSTFTVPSQQRGRARRS